MNTERPAPFLFPYEPDAFWQVMRGIIQEEILKEAKAQRESVALTTSGLTYKPVFKMKEVCAILEVTRPTIYKLIKNGTLRPVKVQSRLVFLYQDLQAFVELKKP